MPPPQRPADRRYGRIVLVAGLAAFGGAALWLVLTGNTGVRYSADHHDTVPMWVRWIPALVGIVLVRLVPPHLPPLGRVPSTPADRTEHREAAVLLAAGVLFAVALWPADGGEPAHTLLKLTFLLFVPLVLFRVARHEGGTIPGRDRADSWRRYGPAIPVAAWFVLAYASPLAMPPSDAARTMDVVTLVGTIVVVFLVNSLLEEVFYRRWLQTRWERVLGPWPAIVLASLLWAVWHVSIQSAGRIDVDLASVIVNQGVQGLFLGYLWSRYRLMWPILVVHGAVNAAPLLISLL